MVIGITKNFYMHSKKKYFYYDVTAIYYSYVLPNDLNSIIINTKIFNCCELFCTFHLSIYLLHYFNYHSSAL